MIANAQDQKLINVLLVEDSPTQALLAKRAVGETDRLQLIDCVEDGVQALQYLRGEGDYCDKDLPDVVLLDINMPGKNGLEVLSEIKSDATLCRIPVVMLTTSDDEDDIATAYECGASSYIVKPVEFFALKTIFEHFADYWTQAARLPIYN